jgi:tetratricopeptide (TPR) repeat protein
LQVNVARAIASAIRLNLTAEQQALLQSSPAVRPEAYEAYLKGVYFWDKRSDEGLRLAVEYFQQAIAVDPSYAPAHAGLAIAYASTGFWGVQAPVEIAGKIEEAAARALELDETLPAAHAAMGLAFGWKGDPVASEREYQRSISLNPAYAFARQQLAETLRGAGRPEEALAELERARESDPLSLIINNSIGWHLYLSRQYDPALAQFQKTLQLDPNFALAHFDLARVYEVKGKWSEALAEFQKAKELSGGSPFTLGGLGHCYAVAGQKDKAREVLAELSSLARHRYVSPLDMAFVYIGLREKDHAFEWLEKARVARVPWLAYLQDDPVYDPLRSDPRFQDIVRRVGLLIPQDKSGK